MEDPAVRSIDSNTDEILRNIDRQARFHCEYPVKDLLAGSKREKLIPMVTNGLFCLNRSGQILNDVKDLMP